MKARTQEPASAPMAAPPAKGGRRSRAAYQAERRQHSISLTFRDVEEKARFMQMAQQQGYASFNAWLLQKLHEATSGAIYPPDYVEGLRREVEKLRAWLDQAREEGAELRRDLKTLQTEKETLVFLIHTLPGGSEAAQDFRQQHPPKGGHAPGGGVLREEVRA